MQILFVVRILGVLLMAFSVTLLPPILVGILYQDGELTKFVEAAVIVMVSGLGLWAVGRQPSSRLRTRDGFIIVSLTWVAFSLLGSLPFVFGLNLSLTDAFFEAASAFTTTGATVLEGLDAMPKSILFYRSQLQWLGGMGVIVLAIALLPLLGIGGMQLYRAETPGPMKDEKMTPRIAHTAQIMWRLYLGLTAACALFYWLAGMDAFDAIAHSFTTLSTGGFSTHDASLGYFASPSIEVVAMVFMLMGGINFGVHFVVWHQQRPSHYWQNLEVRVFLLFVALVIAAVTLTLLNTGMHDSLWEALRYSAFEVVSVVTSTGFGIDNFAVWPLYLPVMLILISFVGGCAGSTAGGMKVIRFVILGKQGIIETNQLVHPSRVQTLKLHGRAVEGRVVQSVWGFFALYVITFGVLMLLLMAAGMDQVTAFGSVATCMNNLGPGLGDTALSFATLNGFEKWVLAFAAILGRLEIYTVFALLSPSFWRS